ncbi:MAG: ATP/GTP-binding protein [Winkia neuii]|uniref:ATP/GTP-binding protein n=1 Tax=Winkia neuii TaxID=33007 RepID=A0A2I1IQP0_9ACTO|nr:hypothetical protein [Winkia neuii]OFJ71938.1 ATP/GTP-binding protein [Actinomyces sp. HMSC064C12]OFK01676.1 ATP/GTP-binding protein [Actinomyces sp. HMSC072A03]OFT54729.1 ATP/GTP-binding protein [Actinomyces sp. HMSC06A08]KWZ74117.1 hypothetical protein HMPREF3198_01064 [Winkia neuii]MDK8100506.1 ATP/GTP-binding protein [Winkia neuii]
MGRKRRTNKWAAPARPLQMRRLASMPRTQVRAGNTYQVQRLPAAEKEYVCPGCNNTIAIGSPHVVAWITEGAFGLDQGVDSRRHWHPYCWNAGTVGR